MDMSRLTKSKKEEVLDVIASIHYEHRYDAGAMMDTLSGDEAENKYRELLGTLPEIPGLTEEDVAELTAQINGRIERIPLVEEAKRLGIDEDELQVDTISSAEEAKAALEKIHYEHRYDAGAMFGTLSSGEAEAAYNRLLNMVNQLEGQLTEEALQELRNEIGSRIQNIPAVEKEKEEEYNAEEERRNTAFEEAKQRFKEKGLFERLKMHVRKQSPKYQDIDFMSLDAINNLYKSDKER